jgi:hypothetical protein
MATQDAGQGLQLLARILELLREERAALESGDGAAVMALATAKERVMVELRQAHGAFNGRNGMRGTQDAALAAAVIEAREANAANGRYAAARLAYVQSRLAGLMQAARGANATADHTGLYRADGFTGGRMGGATFGHA